MQRKTSEPKTIRLKRLTLERKRIIFSNELCMTAEAIDRDSGTPLIIQRIEIPSGERLKRTARDKEEWIRKAAAKDPEYERISFISPQKACELYLKALDAQIFIYSRLIEKVPFLKLLHSEKNSECACFIFEYRHLDNLEKYFSEERNLEDEKLRRVFKSAASALFQAYTGIGAGKMLYSISSGSIAADEEGNAFLLDLISCRLEESEESVMKEWQKAIIPPVDPPYMPPEGYINDKSEFYAFGAYLYEAVSGLIMPPASERKAKDDYLALLSLDSSFPTGLDKIITFGTEILPERRFKSFEDLISYASKDSLSGIECFWEVDIPARELDLYSVRRGDTKTEKITIRKKAPINAIPFVFERHSAEWKCKPSESEPSIKIRITSSSEDEIEAEISVIFKNSMKQGEYKGIIRLDTSYGSCEIATKAFLAVPPFHMAPPAGALYAILFALTFMLVGRPDIISKSGSRFMYMQQWNEIKSITAVSPAQSFSISDNRDWIKTGDSKKGILFSPSSISISASKSGKHVKNGIISSFYAPPSTDFTVQATITKKASDGSKAGIKLFSSRRRYVAASFTDTGEIIFESSAPKCGEIKKIRQRGAAADIKITYSASDYKAKCYAGKNLAAEFGEFEFEDFAVWFYAASSKQNGKYSWKFSSMSAQSGPPLKKLPPYAMKASSKTEISETPEGGGSSGSLYEGDYVTVIEERGENSRIKSKYGNGWIKTSCLQAPIPSETAP